MSNDRNPRPVFKLWFENDYGYVFGPGVYSILKKIEETGTLKEAAASLGMSYRFAWGMIKEAQTKLGQSLIIVHKGGSLGGGGAQLSENGKKLLNDFIIQREKISLILDEKRKVVIQGELDSIEKNNDTKTIVLKQEDNSIIRVMIPESIESNFLENGQNLEIHYFVEGIYIKN
ncbi:LysR family transcriptional regulator [Candidatus Bathyarchaeota archaeon]|nr:LysR family transcriptional regulator [Candidatus Bathyarchaeota archaeon]